MWIKREGCSGCCRDAGCVFTVPRRWGGAQGRQHEVLGKGRESGSLVFQGQCTARPPSSPPAAFPTARSPPRPRAGPPPPQARPSRGTACGPRGLGKGGGPRGGPGPRQPEVRAAQGRRQGGKGAGVSSAPERARRRPPPAPAGRAGPRPGPRSAAQGRPQAGGRGALSLISRQVFLKRQLLPVLAAASHAATSWGPTGAPASRRQHVHVRRRHARAHTHGHAHPWGTFLPHLAAASQYWGGVERRCLGVPAVSHFLLFSSEKSCHSLKRALTFSQD